MQKYEIGILGAGAWGLALGHILQHNGHKVTIREYNKKDCEILDKSRKSNKLPNFIISENIRFSTILDDVLKNNIIVNATPTQYIRALLKSTDPKIREDKIVINAAKGIEIETASLIHKIFDEQTSLNSKNYFSLSGASFANEICSKNAKTELILASNSQKHYPIIRDIFENDFCHIIGSDDIVGVELSGALKNIYAIGAGILDGINISINTKAIYLLKSLEEIQQIGKYLGAKSETFLLSCGLGDLYISCESPLSRNWQVGSRIGKGEKLEDILGSMNMVSEGVSTVKVIHEISQGGKLDLRVCDWIYDCLYKGTLENGLSWI